VSFVRRLLIWPTNKWNVGMISVLMSCSSGQGISVVTVQMLREDPLSGGQQLAI